MPFEHDSAGAQKVASAKWLAMGGRHPPPRTVNAAIRRANELSTEIEIQVRFDGRYWQVDGIRQGAYCA